MLMTILLILGYIIIGGITTGFLRALDPDESAIYYGLLWPIGIPLLIVGFIMFCIAMLVERLVDSLIW